MQKTHPPFGRQPYKRKDKINRKTVNKQDARVNKGIHLRSITRTGPGANPGVFPFNIPLIESMTTLDFESQVTFLVGENGCGKSTPVSYTHLRAHETRHDLVCRLLLEKKK